MVTMQILVSHSEEAALSPSQALALGIRPRQMKEIKRIMHKLPWHEAASLTFSDSEGFRSILMEGPLHEIVCRLATLHTVPKDAFIAVPDRAHKPRTWSGNQIGTLINELKKVRGE